jgi:RND family efflux transporter MFP subunit
MKHFLSSRSSAAVSLACAMALMCGCGAKDTGPVKPPPASVTVSKPAQDKVGDFVEFPGELSAQASVDLRARVKGFLKKVNFVEGAYVKEGDVLFEIDPEEFQARVDSANASIDAAKARQKKGDADLKIKQEMAAGNAASKLDVIQAEANLATANAEFASATANLKQASIDLSYTKIAAPVTGRIDRSRIDPGNLVGSDGNTLLANIISNDPVYVYFDVDEPTVQRFQARMRAQKIDPSSKVKPTLPMTLALGDNPEFKFKGSIDYVDNKVDAASGTIRVRGTLENKEHVLTPGFFCRVRVPDGDMYQAILVPDRSIGVDQGQKYVMVVNDKNVVEARPIETGSQQGRMRVVKTGLKPEEWVITEGLLRTRPGATVAPIQKMLTPTGATTNPVAADNKSTLSTRS